MEGIGVSVECGQSWKEGVGVSTEITTTDKLETAIALPGRDAWDLVQRKARAYSSSTMVPKEYQGSTGMANCIIAIEMAERMNAPILQIMQSMDVIHGRPSFRSQFLIATWNACGRFSAIRYKFSGEGDEYGCVAWAIERDTGEVLEGTRITIGLAKKEGWYTKAGSKWQTMPEQMLRYRSAAWLVRAYAPELSMGLQTTDEVEDVIDGELVQRRLPVPRNGHAISEVVA